MTDREKLEKIKSLADKMYTSMQNLTSDTTPIRKAMDEYHQFLIYEYYKEEPVSEELNSFAIKYAQDKPYPVTVCQAVKVGANWQKEQDKQWLAENHKHIFAKGRDSMKQQMMKEAVEEEVIEIIDYNSSSHHEYSRLMIEVNKEKFKEGDKVKVLIIKED